MTEDVNAIRAKFMEDRQKKIDAEKEKNKEKRATLNHGATNPPAVRGTDGLPPTEPEQDPIEMAESGKTEGKDKVDGDFDVSNAARELAEANGINLADVVATGQNGKITKTDVQNAIDARK